MLKSAFPLLACVALLVTQGADATGIVGSEYKLVLQNPEAYLLAPELRAKAQSADAPEGLTATTPSDAPATPEHLQDHPFSAVISAAARDASVDEALVHAIIFVESRYNAKAVSPKGAVGLMQVLPETAARYGVARPGSSPAENVKAGTRYLKDLMEQFGGRLELVVAAYNAGENAVRRFRDRVPPFAETQAYVPAVLEKYRAWKQPPRARLVKHASAIYANAPTESFVR